MESPIFGHFIHLRYLPHIAGWLAESFVAPKQLIANKIARGTEENRVNLKFIVVKTYR
jgi:hypothetical protein